MTGIRLRLNLMIVLMLSTVIVLLHVHAQDVRAQDVRAQDSPNDLRPIYTYFPSILVCDEAFKGEGPSIGMVTIGETRLQEAEEIYKDYFDVDIEYSEASGETLIYFHRLDDGAIYRRVDVCVIDEVVVASDSNFPSVVELEGLYDDLNPDVGNPDTFQRITVESLVRRYGIPDIVTFSTSPNHRIAFWFEHGVATEFYVVFDPPNDENPPAFGALSRVIYFPFQDVVGYEDRWPFNQTYPEERYIIRTAPYVATDVPTERNPFDFDAIIATITAEPSSTPTPSQNSFEYPITPPSEDILPTVVDLMAVDENCLLPCFWGFHPGETPIGETTRFVIGNFQQTPYISIANERANHDSLTDPSTRSMDFFETFLPLSSEGGSLQIIFRSVDDVLERADIDMFMSANWLEDNPFLLPDLLETYGEPTHVYMRYTGSPMLAYTLAVVYEDDGFMVEYNFGSNVPSDERVLEDGSMLICAEDHAEDSIELSIQSKANATSIREALQPALEDESVYRPFWDIEEMTGLSIGEFTETFAGNPEACIRAFPLSQLRQRGYQ